MVDETLSPPTLSESVESKQVPAALPAILTENSHMPPKVSAVLCIADPQRLNLCRTAVNQFLRYQTYRNFELVIVNSSGQAVTNREHGLVHEIQVDQAECPTLASLRNVGIERAEGEWIMPIDDDDYQHAHRIALQMGHRREGMCSMLSHQVRVDVKNTVVCIHHDPVGIPGSIIFPRVDAQGVTYKYDANWSGPGEDAEFFQRNFGDNRVVVENDPAWFPGPVMMVCCWHGLNTTPREEFLGVYADTTKYKGIRPDEMSDDMVAYLRAALRVYGLELGTDQVEGPASQENANIQ